MQEPLNRIHFMDSMRSVLMMLGVVIHTCAVYEPKQAWFIYSHNTVIIAEYVGDIIHTFRMPAFFVVSGYFCARTVTKYPPGKFIKVRITRIIIPLIFTAITLNSLQTTLLTYTGWHQFDLEKYLLDGGWVSHLWFLNNLIVYFALAVILVKYFSAPTKSVGRYLSDLFLSVPLMIIIFIMPLIPIIIKVLNKVGFPLYYNFMGITNVFSLLVYLPYFVFGSVMANNKKLLQKFLRINPMASLLIIIGAVTFLQYPPPMSEIIRVVMFLYLNTLITWLAVSLCFFIFSRFFNSPSEKWGFLSDASYTVYLFHQVIVIAIGILLIHLDLAPILSMVFLIFITVISTLYIHKHFILKFKVARLLFNGK